MSFQTENRAFLRQKIMAESIEQSPPRSLPDVQSYADARNLAIDCVGVSSVPYPIQFVSDTRSGEEPQSTVGTFDMFVSLPPPVKGTHMSRFVQLLRDWPQPLDYRSTLDLCAELRNRMESSSAKIHAKFPFFVLRAAPATSETGFIRLDIELTASLDQTRVLEVTVKGPATSLCPCSKEISDYGAHNQRCQLTASVRFRCEEDCISVNELFSMMEKSASSSVYPTVKRGDEKHITESAYDNPKFVEDTVRDLALSLKSDPRIAWFRCASENFESIHQHNAFASIEMDLDCEASET